MVKNSGKFFLKFSMTCFCVLLCTFGYMNTVQSKTLSYVGIQNNNNVISDPVLEDTHVIGFEVPVLLPEETQASQITPKTDAVVVEEPVGDHIAIQNVLYKNLLKDVNADHFYLNHNINGDYDGIGVPYVDFRNDFTGRKTIVYAHSTLAGNGPFQVLQRYHNNPVFFANNRMIQVVYQGVTYQYEIFSVYVSVADSEESEGLEYFHRMNYSDDEWGETINWYKSLSEYDTGVSVNSNDKILILQTCSMDPNYYEKSYRYNLLIMGKLV